MTDIWRKDRSKSFREELAREIAEIAEAFCKSADRRKLRLKEDAFNEALKEYAYYCLCGNSKYMRKYIVILNGLIGDETAPRKVFPYQDLYKQSA